MISILLVLAATQGPAYISPSVQGPDRELLQELLAPFPGYQGTAVVVFQDGTTLSNRPEEKVLVSEPVPGKPGIHRWPDGEEFVIPGDVGEVTLDPLTAFLQAVPRERARQDAPNPPLYLLQPFSQIWKHP